MPKKTTSKRVPLPLRIDYDKSFRNDWARLERAGRHDLRMAREVIHLISANEGPLPAIWRDHDLVGEWKDHRECYVAGDFLLIYKFEDDAVVFVRLGTHSELFG